MEIFLPIFKYIIKNHDFLLKKDYEPDYRSLVYHGVPSPILIKNILSSIIKREQYL